MTSRVIALAALVSLAPFAAQAADMPVYKGPPTAVSYFSWNGYYAGLNVGYGWGRSNWEAVGIGADPNGGVFGFTLGANWQNGAMVYGIEGDIGFSSIKGSAACGAFSCETKNDWLGTVRLRLGWAFNQFLPYVTGGLAVGDVAASTTNPAFVGGHSTQYGWALGAGIEMAFTGNWSAKLEYLHVDLGTFDCRAGCSVATPSNVGFAADLVRLGLNYRFSGPIYSRY